MPVASLLITLSPADSYHTLGMLFQDGPKLTSENMSKGSAVQEHQRCIGVSDCRWEGASSSLASNPASFAAMNQSTHAHANRIQTIPEDHQTPC